MSINNTGSSNPFYGKMHSPEHRLATSLRMSGSSNPMAGRPVTEEVKQIIRDYQNKPVFLYNSNTNILKNIIVKENFLQI